MVMKGNFYIQMRSREVEWERTIFTVNEFDIKIHRWEQKYFDMHISDNLIRFSNKWLRNDKKWQEMTRNDKKWQEMTRNDKKWQEMTRNDKKWQEITRNDKKWLIMNLKYRSCPLISPVLVCIH
jgi:hypothetical protein